MFTSLRRDARMVLDGLRGRSPSPLIARPKSPVCPDVAVDALSRARSLEVIEVRRETRDAVTIALRDGRRIEFVPGQFLTVVVTVAGETLRRAYSISRGRDDGGVEITVKRIEGGRVSTWMVEGVQAGMALQVLGPSGEFTADAGAAHVVAVAGGSGITPIMAIARSVIADGGRVSLLYGNRDEDSVIFRDELARMERGGRLAVTHVIGEILDAARIAAWAETVAGPRGTVGGETFHVCGPEGLMAAARAALAARGRLKEERFTAPARRTQATVERAQAVTIRRAGVAMDVVVPAGVTLLDAGLAAGVPMKLSCAMGGCGACAVRLTAGEVVMDEPNCLGADERARGMILACVARPATACTVEAP
jgi:ferredoxin-NADP reductase